MPRFSFFFPSLDNFLQGKIDLRLIIQENMESSLWTSPSQSFIILFYAWRLRPYSFKMSEYFRKGKEKRLDWEFLDAKVRLGKIILRLI